MGREGAVGAGAGEPCRVCAARDARKALVHFRNCPHCGRSWAPDYLTSIEPRGSSGA